MARHRTAALAAAFLAVPLGLMGSALAGPAAAYADGATPVCGTGYRMNLAAGMPNYHGRSGVSVGSAEYFSDQIPGAEKSISGFGTSVSVADINGDGCNDLVVGQPGTSKTKGYVSILWGNSTGLDGSRVTVLTGRFVGDGFGTSVSAVARGDGSGITDLWVGAPDSDVSRVAGGEVEHYTLDATEPPKFQGSIWADVNNSGGLEHDGGHFGQVVQGYPGGVVIGAPDDTVDGRAGAGSIFVATQDHYGYLDRAKYWTQDSPGVPGKAEANDHFGAALYASPNAVIVGVPGEDIGSLKDAGSVQMFVDGAPAQSITQDTKGVPGAVEAGDRFGASVTVGQWLLTQEGFDVAIGAPGEDVGTVKDAGSVTLLTLTGANLQTIDAAKALTQGTGGLGGKIEAGDQVGAALAIIGGDTSAEEDMVDTLVVGVPGEDISGSVDCGLITEYNRSGRTVNYEAERTSKNHFGSVLASTPYYSS